VTSATVLRTERLTPHMVRVVLGGEGVAGFDAGPFADRYVKLRFPPEVEGGRPRLRTYTIRSWDPAAGELAIDFVVHGEEGLAGPWAVAARPGDAMTFLGPGGAFDPSTEADWHLLVGDESALPAIAAVLEVLPAGARVKAFVEVDGPADEQALSTQAAAVDGEVVTWVHRGAGEALVDVVQGWSFPGGVPEVFLHGDAGCVRELRRFVRLERGVRVDMLSASGYWRRGRTEEAWRSEKAGWKAAVEADEQGSAD